LTHYIVQTEILERIEGRPDAGFPFDPFRFFILIDKINRGYVYGNHDKYVPLKSMELKKANSVGHNYRKYIQYAIDNGIIEVNPDKKYKVDTGAGDGYCMEYGIAETIGMVHSFIPTGERMKRERKYPHLRSFLNAGLTIDRKEAESLLNLIYSPDEVHKKRVQLLLVDSINANVHNFIVDETGKRLHTYIVSLKSELRSLLRYEGQILVKVDVKNSQPYLMNYLIKCLEKSTAFAFSSISSEVHQKSTLFKSINSDIIEYINTTEVATGITDPLHIVSVFERLSYLFPKFLCSPWYSSINDCHANLTNSIDVQFFKFLVSTGKFYEAMDELMLSDKIDICEEGTPQEARRKFIKRKCLSLFFSSNKFQHANGYYKNGKFIEADKAAIAVKKAFGCYFPNVYGIIKIINQGPKGNKGPKGLAGILQRIESTIVLRLICERIRKERPTQPIWTIHDCIMTTEGNQEYIHRVMQEEFTKVIEVAPILSIEAPPPHSIVSPPEAIPFLPSKSYQLPSSSHFRSC
jgi:hypothetical protein